LVIYCSRALESSELQNLALKYQMYLDPDYLYYYPINLNSALPTWAV